MAKQTARSRHFDEATTLEVLHASDDRVQARCPHFGTCGGCALQHLAEDKQILAKQRVLLENLERIGHVTPERVLPPLTDAAWGYRRKGRFSVRRVEKKDKTLVGFREQDPRFVADLSDLPHRHPADRRTRCPRWPRWSMGCRRAATFRRSNSSPATHADPTAMASAASH